MASMARMAAMALLAGGVLVAAACDRADYSGGVGLSNPVVPTVPITAQLSPQVLPIFVLPTLACPVAPGFTTGFQLTIVAQPSVTLNLETVTLQLNDGSNIGGRTVTFPSPQLTQMFGTTVVVGSGTFGFEPVFGCGLGVPTQLRAQVMVRDGMGRVTDVTASGAFR